MKCTSPHTSGNQILCLILLTHNQNLARKTETHAGPKTIPAARSSAPNSDGHSCWTTPASRDRNYKAGNTREEMETKEQKLECFVELDIRFQLLCINNLKLKWIHLSNKINKLESSVISKYTVL